MSGCSVHDAQSLSGDGANGGASVLFSGGKDSTLTAALLAERGERVHLLTMVQPPQYRFSAVRVHRDRLITRFGAAHVSHSFIDNAPFYWRVVWGEPRSDLARFGTRLVSLHCLGCKLAMHARVVAHDLEHGIPQACDGATSDSARYFPDQGRPLLAAIEGFYREHGIEHCSPVHDHPDTAAALYTMGIGLHPRFRRYRVIHETQPSCITGFTAFAYSRFVYDPLIGGDAREGDARAYLESKLPLLRRLVADHLARRGLSKEECVALLKEGR